ncbi:2-oxo acid dehydrogenase subunit E2 [Lactococcus piscium]|uniref:Dihydrolipoamide acetyltransferase component of pyruvate dehydrogenase complex n=1 Tax=Pseudolactococcus paracarnosus TaxID=2749962 RepID=A0A7L4WDM2_9LACT|nr:dihydrolipoamide acetyltransferase family protein [Lactococcus paracarnosus]MCJ1994841.1 2-oxo acid dehydrogenase subunit E2 [Lactococcus paracarnosus]QDJ28366.1 dienelactone hydrolase [Lactococcus paracarnosus]SPC35222.1 pyruvate dehydrogenase (dihydrolipoamide acetyltransferase E2 subunit) [Lactococcus piscium]
MTEIFKMPDVGEGMAEGEIASWLVKVGDSIKEDDPIAEIQNDKLLQEILSPYTGVVTKLYVEAGTVVEVGAPLVEFDGDGSGAASAAPVAPEAVAPTPVAAPVVAEAAPTAPVSGKVGAPVIGGQVRAMPSVRRLARQNNIDLTTVAASGRRGNITLEDVRNALSGATVAAAPVSAEVSEAPAAVATPAAAPKAAVSEKAGRVPMTPIRKAIAKNMTSQKQNVPHVTLFEQVEVSKLMAHRAAFKDIALKQDVKLTYMAYVAKALAAMAKHFPDLNAHVDMAKTEIVYPEGIHIGIAVDTPNGLFVPVVKNADQKSILAIAKEIAELAERARDGKLTPDVASGSTITISNIGSARGNWFTPVINVNEAAILGLGTIAKEPIVNEEGEIVVGNMMKLSLSFDHRLVDGMLAQSAINDLKKMLNDPAYMLMEV